MPTLLAHLHAHTASARRPPPELTLTLPLPLTLTLTLTLSLALTLTLTLALALSRPPPREVARGSRKLLVAQAPPYISLYLPISPYISLLVAQAPLRKLWEFRQRVTKDDRLPLTLTLSHP